MVKSIEVGEPALESSYEPADQGPSVFNNEKMRRHLARSAMLTLNLVKAKSKGTKYLTEKQREILRELAANDLEWLANNP